MQFTDSVALGAVRLSRDGYMVVDAKVARAGIQNYTAAELNFNDLPGDQVVRVYRAPEVVFDQKAMSSFAWRPVTIEHPGSMVDASNWKQHSVGITGDSVVRDGEFVRVALTIMDRTAIEMVGAGKRELSAGYTATIIPDSGETPEGEQYDARMENLVGNHLAVVDRARAGPACRIGDEWTTPLPHFTSTSKESAVMPDTLRTVLVDGISIAVTDQGAQAIEKLQKQLADAAKTTEGKEGQISALRDAHAAALAKKEQEIEAAKGAAAGTVSAKDGEIDALRSSHQTELAAKDGEIAALKVQIPDAAAMDALIAEREAVISSARKILGDSFDAKGQSASDIKRAAVSKRLGDAQTQGKDDTYIAAAFDTLTALGVAAPAKDPLRQALANPAPLADASPHPRQAYLEQLTNAWKGAQH